MSGVTSQSTSDTLKMEQFLERRKNEIEMHSDISPGWEDGLAGTSIFVDGQKVS